MKNYFLAMLLVSLTSPMVSAKVWEHESEWDQIWEEKFAAWVKSPAVFAEKFTSDTSPYKGIKADCADVTYSLRAIFSYENKLPFAVKNPGYSAKRPGSTKLFSNEMNTWDKLPEGPARVVALANFLGGSLGSETITLNDSYPVKLDSIHSSDIFSYKIMKDGKPQRHIYNIKDVNNYGNFDLIYSNQQRKKDGQPMAYKTNTTVTHAPKATTQWGFKRFKRPSDFSMNTPSYTDERNFSTEQYPLANTLTETQFFKHVKNSLKKVDETPDATMSRGLIAVCDTAKERIAVVQGAIDHLKKINNRCMNYEEYDAYSTPSRDGRLNDLFIKLETDWKELKLDNLDDQVSVENSALVNSILKSSKLTAGEEQKLLSYCPIQYLIGGETITLNQLRIRFKEKKISFHPNDNLQRRWGIAKGAKTACQSF